MPHIHKDYDFTITVFIVNKSKEVLLVNHPRYNKWVPIGGHIELNEDPEQALYREIEEETGLEVNILSGKPNINSPGTKFILTPNYVDVHEANTPHKHISFTYFAQTSNSNFVLSDEHNDMKWFSLEKLEDSQFALSPSVKFYAKEAMSLARAK